MEGGLKTEEGFRNISWLGHASFKIRDESSGNLIYYIDPFDFKLPEYEKADIIFITHAHFDHCSKDDVNKILKTDTAVIASANCFPSLNLSSEHQRQEVLPNQSYTIKGVSFQTVPAYNVKPERLTYHPRANNWVGYILTVNGRKMYHAGDTDFIPEMKSFDKLRLNIAMLPMGGTYTMDVSEAIEAANAIGATITIPMHYKRLLVEKSKAAEEQFRRGVTNSRVVVLTQMSD